MHFAPRQHSGAVLTLIKLPSYIVNSRILFNPQWYVALTRLKIKYASFFLLLSITCLSLEDFSDNSLVYVCFLFSCSQQ